MVFCNLLLIIPVTNVCAMAQNSGNRPAPVTKASSDSADSWASLDRIEKDLLEKVKKISFRHTFCPRKITLVKLSVDINQAFLREEDVQLESDNKHYKCIVDLTLRQRWNNPRLAFDNTAHPELEYVTVNSNQGIWTPDLYFPGELGWKSTTQIGDHNNTVLWIYPNGDVYHSVRLKLQFLTTFDDKTNGRICTIPIESYRCSIKTLQLAWDDKEAVRTMDRVGGNSVVMDSNIHAKYYKKTIAKVVAGRVEIPVKSFGGVGNFTQIFAQFAFEPYFI